MKAERGQYRSITVVLLDGPDFQALPPEARWVFTCLKIGLGPAGIEVEYPDALVAKLAARAGYDGELVREELDRLEAAGWIKRERHVVWVVKQLQFEPAMTPKNELHRKSVQSHVAGLPRLAIVAEFIRAYQAYFVDPEELAKTYPKPSDSPSIAPAKGIEGVSYHRDIDRDRNRDRDRDSPPDGGTPVRGWPDEFTRMYAVIGVVKPGQVGRYLKPLVDLYGEERTKEMWAYYIRQAPRTRFGRIDPGHWDTTHMSPADFAKNAGTWAAKTQPVGGGDAATAS